MSKVLFLIIKVFLVKTFSFNAKTLKFFLLSKFFLCRQSMSFFSMTYLSLLFTRRSRLPTQQNFPLIRQTFRRIVMQGGDPISHIHKVLIIQSWSGRAFMSTQISERIVWIVSFSPLTVFDSFDDLLRGFSLDQTKNLVDDRAEREGKVF